MAKETRPPIHLVPKAGVASLTRKMRRERPLLKEKCLGWRSSASALKVGCLGPNPSPATHQLSRETGQVGSDVLESSEKMKRDGAAGRGHSSGTSLEGRAGHGAPSHG